MFLVDYKKMRNKALKTFTAFIIGLLICMTGSAHGAQPLDTLKEPIGQILDILKDPRYQEASQKDLQHDKIRELINKVFDFNAIARRAVGRYWKRFNLKEKKEFTEVFAELLSNSYIKQLQGEFQNETVDYLTEKMLSDTKALVKTKIIRENIDIPVDYRLRLLDKSWMVYDINIEGVSLVKNYRTQFNKILLKKPPAHLIERLKRKVARQKNRKE